MVQSEPGAIGLLSGENTTNSTQLSPSCTCNGWKHSKPEATFQRQTVPSAEPDAMCTPSQEIATDKTPFVCPVKRGRTFAHEVLSHTQIVISIEPETMQLPSNEKNQAIDSTFVSQ